MRYSRSRVPIQKDRIMIVAFDLIVCSAMIMQGILDVTV